MPGRRCLGRRFWEKKITNVGGVERWRKGETRTLNTAEGKKEKKSTYCPVFSLVLFCFVFIYTTEKSPWRCHGRACTGQPLGGVGVFREVLICFQVRPIHCPVGPCCKAVAVAFSLLLLLLLQVEGLQDLRPSRWWPGTGGWVVGSSARAPRLNCLSLRTSCTCSGWQKPHCSRSGTS